MVLTHRWKAAKYALVMAKKYDAELFALTIITTDIEKNDTKKILSTRLTTASISRNLAQICSRTSPIWPYGQKSSYTFLKGSYCTTNFVRARFLNPRRPSKSTRTSNLPV